MEQAADEVEARIATAAESKENQTLARHIISIERWSQGRLRTLLGEELVMDEYDGYRPEDGQLMERYAAILWKCVRLRLCWHGSYKRPE